MTRKMEYMKGLPRYTVTYCQYGDARMKPTDNHPAPDFRPMCHNCDGCHTAAPRGSKTGTQGLKNSKERAKIPERISELSRNIDELIKLAAGGDTKQSIADIQKFSNEMTALREFIESEKAKQSSAEKDNRQLETVLDMLEKENFQLTEYDDVAVRHLIEYIKVIDKNALLICFKGGFEVRKEI